MAAGSTLLQVELARIVELSLRCLHFCGSAGLVCTAVERPAAILADFTASLSVREPGEPSAARSRQVEMLSIIAQMDEYFSMNQ